MHQEFKVHLLNDDGIAKAKELAEKFDSLLDWVEGIAQPGRELSLVKTKLEEASFFAKKSMAINSQYQKL